MTKKANATRTSGNCATQRQEKAVPVYNPDDFLDTEERKRLVQAAQTLLEILIAYAYLKIGSRTAEFGNSRIKNWQFLSEEKDCVLFHVGEQNKTGYRQIKLYEPFTSALRNYLNQHPFRADPDAPLLLNSRAKHLSYGGFYKKLRALGERAGIEKRLNPYSGRHLVYTDCQVKGVPQTLIDLRFGHVHGSRMAKKYTHAKFKDLHDYEDAMHGKREQRYKPQELEMQFCPQCEQSFAPDQSFCPKCGRHCEQTVRDEQQKMKGNFLSNENAQLFKQILDQWATEKGII